ncbi:hypothetical protein JCM15519_11590 [Fundidesulfovibrio butyratiphilus]
MTIAFILLIGFPVVAIFLMASFSPRFGLTRRYVRVSSMLFAAWLVATVIFSPYTMVLQVGGLPDITLERGLLVVIFVIVCMRLYRHDLLQGQSKQIEALMVLFCVICIISMARFGFLEAYSAFSRPSFVFMSGYLLPFLSFVFTKYMLDNEDDLLVVFKALFWLGGYLTITAFLERSSFKYLVWPAYIVDPAVSTLHLDRARGPFLNAAFNGVALNVAFLCGFLVYPTLRGARRWAYVVMMILMVGAIYLTRTRSVYIHFLFTGLALVTVYRHRLSLWRILPAAVLVLMILIGTHLDKLMSSDRLGGGIGQMTEVYIRLALAEKSLNLLSEHPFGGVGLAQFKTSSLFTPEIFEYQHNQLIGIAVELGLPGAFVYLAILLTIFVRIAKLVDYIPAAGMLGPNMVLVLALLLMVSLWNAVFVEPTMHLFVSTSFFVFAGIIDQLYNRYVLRRL